MSYSFNFHRIIYPWHHYLHFIKEETSMTNLYYFSNNNQGLPSPDLLAELGFLLPHCCFSTFHTGLFGIMTWSLQLKNHSQYTGSKLFLSVFSSVFPFNYKWRNTFGLASGASVEFCFCCQFCKPSAKWWMCEPVKIFNASLLSTSCKQQSLENTGWNITVSLRAMKYFPFHISTQDSALGTDICYAVAGNDSIRLKVS